MKTRMFSITYRIGFILIQVFTSICAQSTTASYLQSENYMDDTYSDYKYPRSKYYYFFTPRSQSRDLEETSETMIEDRDEGYQAQWPSSKVIHQQPIHVHHAAPYHKEEKSEHSYLLPLLLLGLLPFLLGALLLLPLLFTFFTNILQLLALMQQTMQNMGNNTGGGRKRRNDPGSNPILVNTILSLVEKFISAQLKYKD